MNEEWKLDQTAVKDLRQVAEMPVAVTFRFKRCLALAKQFEEPGIVPSSVAQKEVLAFLKISSLARGLQSSLRLTTFASKILPFGGLHAAVEPAEVCA